jgi:hypothetical protein
MNVFNFIAFFSAVTLVTNAKRCGTTRVDLSPLQSTFDFVLPAGVPCNVPQCPGGVLPWSFYFNFCQPISTTRLPNCQGAAACQQWPGGTASLGQFANVTYIDVDNGVAVFATDGSQFGTNTPVRQMLLTILCANASDPYPTFTSEDEVTTTFSFVWNRVEVCQQTPAPAPCDGKACLGALQHTFERFQKTAWKRVCIAHYKASALCVAHEQQQQQQQRHENGVNHRCHWKKKMMHFFIF